MRRFLILLTIVLISNMTLTAQSGCDINLEDAILNLVQAQRAADGGDTLTAVAILQGVQSSIDNATSGCDRIRFDATFTTPDETLSFKYPDGWQVQSLEQGLYVASSSSAIVEQMGDGVPEDLNAGDAGIVLQIQRADGDTFDDIVEDVIDDIGSDISIISPQEETSVRGRRTIGFNVNLAPSVSGHIVFMDFTDNEDEPAVMLILGIATSDSLPIIEVYTNTFRDSVQYPPGQSLREFGVSADDITYTSYDDTSDLVDEGVRSAYLSADGTQFVYQSESDTICIHTINTRATNCATSELALDDRPTGFFWSPDGRYIAFHADFLRMFVDADVWVYDVENGNFINLTDDGSDARMAFSGEIETTTWLDFAITWGPDNLLYVIRQTVTPQDDGLQGGVHELIQVDPDSGDTTVIANLTNTFELGDIFEGFIYSFDGTMAVSPDATQMAVSVIPRERDDPKHGIWLIDLTTGDFEQITTSSSVTIGVSEDALEENSRFITNGIGWTADSTGLFTFSSDPTFGLVGGMVHHIDIASGAVTPVLDMSDLTRDEIFEAIDNSSFDVLLMSNATMTPDYENVVIVQSLPSGFNVMRVPFAGGEFGEIEEIFRADDETAFSERVQIGLNGNMVITRLLLRNAD